MSAHGTRSRYVAGCRCAACRRANADGVYRMWAERAALVAKLGGLPPHAPHGLSAYKNWGCRCGVCKAANRDYQAAYRARKAG